MSTHSSRLMYAGTLPFLLSLLCILIEIKLPFDWMSVDRILTSYSLLIASFMAGVHWGQHLSEPSDWQHTLAFTSNAIALSAWFIYLLLPLSTQLFGFALIFLSLLAIDYKLFQAKILTYHYFYNRRNVTLIVVCSLLISGLFL